MSVSLGGVFARITNRIQTNYTQEMQGMMKQTGMYDMEGYFQQYFNVVSDDILLQNADRLWNMMMDMMNILLIIAGINMLITIFLFAPLEVGCKRWFLRNRTEQPQMKEVTYSFDKGYLNTVKVMFCRSLFTSLWSLLFVIPGIVKAYEYRMIPFLLAENPNMDRREAFARSRDMMEGNKWDAFVLDLSFIGWNILAGLFWGVIGLLWVNPYVYATDTELYVALCQGANQNRKNDYNFYGNGSGTYESVDLKKQSGIDSDMFR